MFAEIIRHKFAKDVIIKDIKTATETMGSKDGRENQHLHNSHNAWEMKPVR